MKGILMETAISPNTAKRWLACPGSASKMAVYNKSRKKVRGSKVGSGSTPALIGSVMHRVAEHLLTYPDEVAPFIDFIHTSQKEHKAFVTLLGKVVPSDNLESNVSSVMSYVSFVNGLIEGSDCHRVEMKVCLDELAPNAKGIIDALVVKENILHVIDFKTGRHNVTASDNPQLKLYAWGALRSLEQWDIDEVNLHIHQKGKLLTFETTPTDIENWFTYISPIAKSAYEGTGKCYAGSHCVFCSCKRGCNEWCEYDKAMAEVKPIFKMPIDRIAMIRDS